MAPRVTVVVPARDEAAHIERCVRSIRAQDIDGGLELLVVDGLSTDATAELARRAGAAVLVNPARTIPAALNVGLRHARGDVIVRFDAHAEMPPGYVSACVDALEAERAGNVGGWRFTRGAGPWGHAVGRALASPFGVGNSRIWRAPAAGERRRDVDTVPLGCFRAEALRRVGGWNERLLTNEDFDLNHRLRVVGERIVFDPTIWSVYHPRETLGEVACQYWRYGRWKAEMLRAAPASIRPRQLAPPGLALAAVAAVLPSPLSRPARGAVAAYVLLLSSASRRRGGWRVGVVLATMHVCWAGGLAEGVARTTPEAISALAAGARRRLRRSS